VCSSLLLIAASPVLLAMALYIKVVSPGPVFFRQARVGRGGRPFEMLKFRTMHVGVDVTAHKKYMAELIRNGESADKPMVKRDEQNPAIIPFGNIIRKSCVARWFNTASSDWKISGRVISVRNPSEPKFTARMGMSWPLSAMAFATASSVPSPPNAIMTSTCSGRARNGCVGHLRDAPAASAACCGGIT